MNYSVILLIAGKGKRCNLDYNKIFFELNGKPLFLYALDVFRKDKKCEEIIVVYNENDFNILKEHLADYDDKRIKLVAGGAERQDSVLNGLMVVTSDYVLVHDGARANINQNLINRVLEGFKESDVVSLGLNVTDTIKKVSEKFETVNRNNLYYVQTPQGAKTSVLIRCIQKANDDEVLVTDDLMAVELYSDIRPVIVQGEKSNIKVTTQEDLSLLKYYME